MVFVHSPDIDVVPLLGIREPFSSLTHFAGAMIFAGLAQPLLRRGRGDPVRFISLAVFAAATIEMLVTSGTYHLCWPGPLRTQLLRADVCSVFIMIAASMTPGQAILFSGPTRWGSLIVIWAAALAGIAWRLSVADASPGVLGIGIFLIFGWASVAAGIVLWQRYGWQFVQPAVFSGLAYSLGATGLTLEQPTLVAGAIESHEVWHIAVLIGLALQWKFVFQFASGPPRQEPSRL